MFCFWILHFKKTHHRQRSVVISSKQYPDPIDVLMMLYLHPAFKCSNETSGGKKETGFLFISRVSFCFHQRREAPVQDAAPPPPSTPFPPGADLRMPIERSRFLPTSSPSSSHRLSSVGRLAICATVLPFSSVVGPGEQCSPPPAAPFFTHHSL